MLSAVISSERSYPAVLLAEQLVHQWLVHPGPLVLGATLLNLPTPTADRDRTVSRRSEPSSRTALNGEQPYPWDLLQPQDAMEAGHRRVGQNPSPGRIGGGLFGGGGFQAWLFPGGTLFNSFWRRMGPFHSEPTGSL